MSRKCIGIDIGGTTVKLGMFEQDGTLLEKWEIPTRKENGGAHILEDIAAAIKKKAAERGLSTADFEEPAWDFRDRSWRTATWNSA